MKRYIKELQDKIYSKYTLFLFKIIRRLIHKHFSYSLNMIEGSDSMKGKPIAWKWIFIDEKWEKIRYEKK